MQNESIICEVQKIGYTEREREIEHRSEKMREEDEED